MQLPNYIIIVVIEIYLLLILVGIFLLYHLRNLRGLVRRQQEKLQHLIGELTAADLPPRPLPVVSTPYKTHITNQLAVTLRHFKSLAPDGDITTTEPPQSSSSLQALALRYRYLQAEDVALIKGDGPLQINWQVFEDYLIKQPANPDQGDMSEELATYKKRIENLEKFKHLFFDMEQQWLNAQEQAGKYYTQLAAMADTVNDKNLFADVLGGYHNVYAGINAGFEIGRRDFSNHVPDIKTVHVARFNPQNSAEIIKLRNVAADQHRIIAQLQQKLEEAITAEAKESIIGELKQQLQRQVRFVQESETCIQLLEEELSAANERLHKHEQQAAEAQHEQIQIKEILHSFTLESKSLMENILAIEEENEILQQRLSSEAGRNSTKQSEILQQTQAELSALQNEYTELETKYLDLKLRN